MSQRLPRQTGVCHSVWEQRADCRRPANQGSRRVAPFRTLQGVRGAYGTSAGADWRQPRAWVGRTPARVQRRTPERAQTRHSPGRLQLVSAPQETRNVCPHAQVRSGKRRGPTSTATNALVPARGHRAGFVWGAPHDAHVWARVGVARPIWCRRERLQRTRADADTGVNPQYKCSAASPGEQHAERASVGRVRLRHEPPREPRLATRDSDRSPRRARNATPLCGRATTTIGRSVFAQKRRWMPTNAPIGALHVRRRLCRVSQVARRRPPPYRNG